MIIEENVTMHCDDVVNLPVKPLTPITATVKLLFNSQTFLLCHFRRNNQSSPLPPTGAFPSCFIYT